MRTARILAAAVIVLAAAMAGYLLSDSRRLGQADASQLLAAALPDLSGIAQPLSNWQGKVLVINFWATWCPPCLEEIPHFVRMQRELGPRGLQFIGIAVDEPDKVKAFAREHAINYPIMIGQLDAIELSKAAGNKSGGLPYTLVLDRSGTVISQHAGGLTERTLKPIVVELL